MDLDALNARCEELTALEQQHRFAAQQIADAIAETRGRRLEIERLIQKFDEGTRVKVEPPDVTQKETAD